MKTGAGSGIKVRIFSGLGALMLLFVVIFFTAYVALNNVQKSQRKILEENFGNLYDLPTLRSNVNAQRLAVAVMLETPRDKWGPWLDDLTERRARADSIINHLILRLRDEPKESERLGAFIEIRDAYQRVQDTQKELLVNDGKSQEAKELFLGIQMENYIKMRAIIGELEETELKEARAIVRETEESATARTRAFLIMETFGILIAAALAVYMNRTVASYVSDVRVAQGDSSRANRALMMINACNATVIRATDETQLLEDVCREIVEIGGYKMAWVGYADDDKNKSVRPMAFAGEDGDYIEHARVSWGENERGNGPTGTCIRTGEIVIARDISTQAGYEPWRYRAIEKGYRSSATFPLRDNRRVYGALMVYSGTTDAFDEREAGLLKELADDLAYATSALRDQSARQQAEKKTRESAVYARSLLEASLDPLISISPSGKITDVNAAMEEATGRCRRELVGRDFADCFTEPEKARTGHRTALTKGFVRDYLLTIRHTSGRNIDVLYNASVFRDEAGEVQGVFAAAREILKEAPAC